EPDRVTLSPSRGSDSTRRRCSPASATHPTTTDDPLRSGEGEAMATYVLVHGGGHGGWCYQPTAELLRAAGHRVLAPSLTGCGERKHLLAPGIDLDTHIEDVVSLLFYEDLRDVILVGHSYGGMVVTGVADRAADRVGRIVYLDAANPVDGQSLVDVAGPIILATREDLR